MPAEPAPSAGLPAERIRAPFIDEAVLLLALSSSSASSSIFSGVPVACMLAAAETCCRSVDGREVISAERGRPTGLPILASDSALVSLVRGEFEAEPVGESKSCTPPAWATVVLRAVLLCDALSSERKAIGRPAASLLRLRCCGFAAPLARGAQPHSATSR